MSVRRRLDGLRMLSPDDWEVIELAAYFPTNDQATPLVGDWGYRPSGIAGAS